MQTHQLLIISYVHTTQCTHTHTHTHTYIYTHSYIHVCICICICIYRCVNLWLLYFVSGSICWIWSYINNVVNSRWEMWQLRWGISLLTPFPWIKKQCPLLPKMATDLCSSHNTSTIPQLLLWEVHCSRFSCQLGWELYLATLKIYTSILHFLDVNGNRGTTINIRN